MNIEDIINIKNEIVVLESKLKKDKENIQLRVYPEYLSKIEELENMIMDIKCKMINHVNIVYEYETSEDRNNLYSKRNTLERKNNLLSNLLIDDYVVIFPYLINLINLKLGTSYMYATINILSTNSVVSKEVFLFISKEDYDVIFKDNKKDFYEYEIDNMNKKYLISYIPAKMHYYNTLISFAKLVTTPIGMHNSRVCNPRLEGLFEGNNELSKLLNSFIEKYLNKKVELEEDTSLELLDSIYEEIERKHIKNNLIRTKIKNKLFGKTGENNG